MNVVAPGPPGGGPLPETFVVELALGEDERQPGRMRVFRGRDGRPAATEFRTLERFGRFAFVECRPLTGRRHQVRLHLAAIGAPVLHDPLYGVPELELRLSDLKPRYKGRADEKPLIRRLALHASTLTVRHPTTGEPVTISAPLPHEFEVALKYLRKFAR
jgi:23S rRNA-/tRNA-specific pseudouridylate synthase